MGHSTWQLGALGNQLAGRISSKQGLSIYQTTIGSVSATTEGWALYAERLMDELGHLSIPGTRLGCLDAQQMRAVRVVLDIGMHLQLRVPDDSPQLAGETCTPTVARAFFGSALRSVACVPGQRDRPLPGPAGAGDQLQAR